MADERPTEEELIQSLDDQQAQLQARVADDLAALTEACSELFTSNRGTPELEAALDQIRDTAGYVAAMPYPSDVLNADNDVVPPEIPPSPSEPVPPPIEPVELPPTGGEAEGPASEPDGTIRPTGPGSSGAEPASDDEPVGARLEVAPGEVDPFEEIEQDDDALATTAEELPDDPGTEHPAGPSDPDPVLSDAVLN